MASPAPDERPSHIDRTRRRPSTAPQPGSPEKQPPAGADKEGRYRWIRKIGEGGMGEVWQGLDIELNRTVALKRMRPELAAIPELLKRFQAEARALAKFSHPRIVQIYDVADDHRGPFLVMQWVQGHNLADVIEAEGPLPPARAAILVAKVASAMQQAHVNNVIHRDIKCANILLTDRDEPMITDFGIALTASAHNPSAETGRLTERQTQTGAIIGSLEYMSPEQMRESRSVTAASDIYSLGATLFCLVTGRSPARINVRYVPECLRNIVEKATEERPADRYTSMLEFASALRQVVAPRADASGQTSEEAAVRSPTSFGSNVPTVRRVRHPAAGQPGVEPKPGQQEAAIPRTAMKASASQQETGPTNTTGALPGSSVTQKWPLTRRHFGMLGGALTMIVGANFAIDRILSGRFAFLERIQRIGPPPSLLQAPFDPQTAVVAQEAWARHLGTGIEVANPIGMKFRIIPPGEFLMGSPETEVGRTNSVTANIEKQHPVTITQPFLLAVYPVTQAEWQAVMGDNPSYFRYVQGEDASRFPVEQVSWNDSQQFIARLNQSAPIRGWRYRLPTEAEWEYACRAGTQTPFWFGNQLNGTQANCNGYSPYGTMYNPNECVSLGRPSVVGSYAANPFGIHDQHGNIWEWCEDWYADDYSETSPVQDPAGPETGTMKVFRGGSWYQGGTECRSAHRYADEVSSRFTNYGLRILCELM